MDFSNILIKWYIENKRDLPWRNTTNPYKIWLSEIILQQTRVEQGLDYYLRFLLHYPTIKDLANAKEEEVLKLWQGLGYYSRARNLHFTAKHIAEAHKGNFPTTFKEILKLKGVGEYTASAIASFSYNLPHAVVDGNVYRVLSRLFEIKAPIDTTKGQKTFKALANKLINKNNPAEHNQAIMEFGALQCKPKKPNCGNCVFIDNCLSYKNNSVDTLPLKKKKIRVVNRFFNYLIFIDKNYTLINQRINKDIWQGLYDFPLVESTQSINHFEDLNLKKYKKLNKLNNIEIIKSDEFTHILSHQKIYATFWILKLKDVNSIHTNELKVFKKNFQSYPIPKLIENFIFKSKNEYI